MTQSGDGTDMGSLEERVGRLEQDAAKIKTDIKTLLVDLAYLKGRAELTPSISQLIGFAVAVFVAAGVMRLSVK